MERKKSIQVVVGITVLIVVAAGLYALLPGGGQSIEHIVTISSCDAIAPSVLKAQGGEPVIFKNIDTVEHIIQLSGQIVQVPAGDKRQVSTQLQYGPGTYAYTCDGIVNAGQIQITSVTQPEVETLLTFKEAYEVVTELQKICMKEALGDSFEDAYNNPSFDFTGLTEGLNKCLLPVEEQD